MPTLICQQLRTQRDEPEQFYLVSTEAKKWNAEGPIYYRKGHSVLFTSSPSYFDNKYDAITSGKSDGFEVKG